MEDGHDAPIASAKDDYFEAAEIARAVHRTIEASPKNWSTRIGLYGSWGSGKTSIFNLLGEISGDWIVVRFSAWSAASEGGVLSLFYDALRRKLQERGIKISWFAKVKRVAAQTRQWRVFGGIRAAGKAAEAGAHLPAGATDLLFGAANIVTKWLDIKEKDLKKLLIALGERRVVVLVDDLDRADPRVLPKGLLALRELLDWPQFAFVLAFDREVVARALSEYSSAFGSNAHIFLEKIVDFSFEVPRRTVSQKERFARHVFATCCDFFPSELIPRVASYLPDEPRRVKIIARSLGVLRQVAGRHNPDELDWYGLVLFAIVAAASSNCARWLRATAADDSERFSLAFANNEERVEKERELLSTVRSKLDDVAEPLRDSISRVALQLLEHWQYVDGARVQYWLDLTSAEPPITLREFAAFRETWTSARSDAPITEILSGGATFASVETSVVAEELFRLGLDDYRSKVGAMAECQTEHERKRLLAEAKESLALLEYLWSDSGVPEIREAARNERFSGAILELVSRWLTWKHNDGETELRERERRLALIAAKQCRNQERLYADTDPYWDGYKSHLSDPAALSAWITEYRASIVDGIVARLVARFNEPEGLAEAAKSDDELSTWLIESPKSPMYDGGNLSHLLTKTLQSQPTEGATFLSQNAKVYLEMLLFRTRNGSWGGPAKLPEIYRKSPDIIPAAWSAVLSSPVPFRMISTLNEIRDALLAAGIPGEVLLESEWLREGKAYLQQLAIGSRK